MAKQQLLTKSRMADPLCKAPLVELTGERQALIENHQGVLAYSDEEIQIKVHYGSVAVLGKKLYLRELSKEQLVISGHIDTVRLIRR